MDRTKNKNAPEELFTQALIQSGSSVNKTELRLLTAGLGLLRSNEKDPQRLNYIELTAISGMISYVSFTQNVPEKMVHSVLCSAYGVPSIQEIKPSSYDDVVDYLMNVTIQNALN